MENKTNKKGLIAGIIVLVVLVAAFLIAWSTLKPETNAGAKTVTLKVINSQGETKEYVVKTNAEVLRQVMDEAKGFEYEGIEDSTSFMVTTVNGETADWSVNQSYWGFYINGEYCNYGIKEQPVADGDVFTIEYTIG